MHTLVLEIVRDPASVHKNGLLFARCIQVGVEGSDNVDTLLTVAYLLNLYFTSVVKDATNLHGLHGPVALELVKLVSFGGPDELSLVGRGDVDCLLAEESLATLSFLAFLLTTTALILGSLVHKD